MNPHDDHCDPDEAEVFRNSSAARVLGFRQRRKDTFVPLFMQNDPGNFLKDLHGNPQQPKRSLLYSRFIPREGTDFLPFQKHRLKRVTAR